MAYDVSELYNGMDHRWWGFDETTEVCLLDYSEFREKYVDVIALGDLATRTIHVTGTDRGPLEVLDVHPWGYAERVAVYEKMLENRRNRLQNEPTATFSFSITQPKKPTGPLDRSEAEALVVKREQNQAQVDAYYQRGRLGRAMQVARAFVGMTSDWPDLRVAYNAGLPDVLVMGAAKGPKEVAVSITAEETYRSLPPRLAA